MKFRTKQTLMLAGTHERVRLTGFVVVPWWLRILIALTAALAIAWISLSAAHAQEITSGSPDVLGAAVVKQGLFATPESKSSSAGIAFDGAGNIHAAYINYIPLAEHPQAIYLFCPATADCADGENWSAVGFLDEVDQVQIAVTTDGRPRLMIRTTSQEQPGAREYVYAECNADCTEPASWGGAMIAREYSTLGDVFIQNSPRRNFALDPQGRPRFIYSDANYLIEPDHYGAFYLWCDANCADHTPEDPTWREVNVARYDGYRTESFDLPALAFTPGGKPHIVSYIYPIDDEPEGVYYVGCDAACDQTASWQRVWIHERGSETDVSWDIDVQSNAMPRIAVYEGSQLEGKGEELFYLSCDADCFTGAGWSTLNLGLGQENGIGVDIELVEDKPRLLYLQDGGLGVALAECDGGCESATNWSSRVLETSDEVEAEFPVARPITCDAGFWDLRAPRLAFAPSGRMMIAYNGSYQARCLYQDPADPTIPPYYRFHEVRHNARYAFWAEDGNNGGGDDGGGDGGNNESVVYLPMVRR